MALRVEPSLVRVKDTRRPVSWTSPSTTGRGTRTRRVFLGGRDPERLVRFSFSPPSIDVFAGEVGRARLRIEAPAAAAGQEATRAADRAGHLGGHRRISRSARRSCRRHRPRRWTPRWSVRLDPSVVRVRDTAVGQLEAIIDNRGGHRVRRVFLTGRDPERLVRFTFSPPSLDVLPGDIGRVRVRLEAPLPEPGPGGDPAGHGDRRGRRPRSWRRAGRSCRSRHRRRSRRRSR